ncbi:helix-turn-helix domain-containing protein [Malikia sp.]|uniref:helix-turn-helix domain-containing protein n=1 Tax=Malikia sp. TaxID=2070706 RepID=UPI00261F0011|nr:helix-turn-helix domain-containing protein [Malikia sp.]MDD2729179.1 helix-turn-helix domain-containing protein [Malikia sp.]
MHESTFSLVPLEVIKDKRLTLWQVRVLVALFSFRNKNTDTVFPSRKAIAERSGMHPSNISAATTELVGLGWLTKEGAGGFSKSSRYTITVPDFETVADFTTVAAPTTVADSAIRMRVVDFATRKEQTNEQTKGESANKSAPTPPKARKKSKALPLTDWLAQVAASGVKAIS